ncbi:MAG: hypothetical protein ACK5H2_09810 [Beutenbergiaceae bacterium]
MTGPQARLAVVGKIEALGFRWHGSNGHDDSFVNQRTNHRLVLSVAPRWGRRVDILTAISSFPTPCQIFAPAFRFDLGTQVSPQSANIAARWSPAKVSDLVAVHLLPYLEQAHSAAAILDLLVRGEVMPMGAPGVPGVVQQGFYLAKWWQLQDQITPLGHLSAELRSAERERLAHAPWGRTELAEVLFDGRELSAAPNRIPWGFGDQGDPRAEMWLADPAGTSALRHRETSRV